MPEITGISDRMREALRQFSIEQRREIDVSSPPVRVLGGRCLSCGFEVELSYETPADALRAVTMTHELSWVTGKRCGGQVAFVTAPVLVVPKGR